LVLVHGWGSGLGTWTTCVPKLAKEHRVVAVDLRGHGDSPVPEHGYGPSDLAADLADLIDRLGLAPVVAVGPSRGAPVVSVLAVQHPAAVSGLVVVDPAYGADDEEAALVHGRLAELRRDGAAAAVRQHRLTGPLAEQMLATPGHVLAEAYAGMYVDPGAFGLRPTSERFLARRTCPVLALHARREPARWESSLPIPVGSCVVLWEGGGHFLHEERPDDFADLVTHWVDQLAARAGHRQEAQLNRTSRSQPT